MQYTADGESDRHVPQSCHVMDWISYWLASSRLQYEGHTILYSPPDWLANGPAVLKAEYVHQHGFRLKLYVLQCHLQGYGLRYNAPRHDGLQKTQPATLCLPDPAIHL